MDDDIKAFTVRLPSDLHEWLRHEAFHRKISMNEVIVGLVSELKEVMEENADNKVLHANM